MQAMAAPFLPSQDLEVSQMELWRLKLLAEEEKLKEKQRLVQGLRQHFEMQQLREQQAAIQAQMLRLSSQMEPPQDYTYATDRMPGARPVMPWRWNEECNFRQQVYPNQYGVADQWDAVAGSPEAVDASGFNPVLGQEMNFRYQFNPNLLPNQQASHQFNPPNQQAVVPEKPCGLQPGSASAAAARAALETFYQYQPTQAEVEQAAWGRTSEVNSDGDTTWDRMAEQTQFYPPPGLSAIGAPDPSEGDLGNTEGGSGGEQKKRNKRRTRRTQDSAEKTTMMLRNIANQYTIEQLVDDLNTEFHLKPVTDYDYVYLPTDFNSKRNKSYGFVNFTSAERAARFRDVVQTTNTQFHAGHGEKPLNRHSSQKILEVAEADQQGRDSNILEYLRIQSGTGVMNPWFRPVVLLSAARLSTLTLDDHHSTVVVLEELWPNVYAVKRKADSSPSASSWEAPPPQGSGAASEGMSQAYSGLEIAMGAADRIRCKKRRGKKAGGNPALEYDISQQVKAYCNGDKMSVESDSELP